MIERTDISQVLAEMRTLRAQIQKPSALPQEVNPQALKGVTGTEKTGGFGEMLTSAIGKVNETQQTASKLATAYEQGDPTVDITRVMIAAQKSSVSFQALTQVRNKVVQAYEEVMKMSI